MDEEGTDSVDETDALTDGTDRARLDQLLDGDGLARVEPALVDVRLELAQRQLNVLWRVPASRALQRVHSRSSHGERTCSGRQSWAPS